MPSGKTWRSSRSETLHVLRRASTFLLWLQALMATIAQAAPAASHNKDSTPRAFSSRLRWTDDAGIGFMGRWLLLAAGPLYEPFSTPTSIAKLRQPGVIRTEDRKSTRLNSRHSQI